MINRILIGCLLCVPALAADYAPSRYDVTWDAPGGDAHGSVPLGNGEIGLNAWLDKGGDLVLLISRTDAWDDNGRLVKVGRVRVTLDPAPPAGAKFQQTLSPGDGTLRIRHGEGDAALRIAVWVDANHPLIHVTADGAKPVGVMAALDLWRTERYELPSFEVSDVMLDRSKPGQKREAMFVEPDTVFANLAGRIAWCHHNAKSVGPAITMKIQGLADVMKVDPLLHRTFGGIVTAANARRIDDRTLQLPPARSQRLDIAVVAQHPATPEQWLKAAGEALDRANAIPVDQRRAAHDKWWAEFWNRSWIDVELASSAEPPSIVPASRHAVKIGVDQGGGNRLAGQLGRIGVWGRALTEAQVAQLAKASQDQPAPIGEALYGGTPQVGAALEKSQAWSFEKGMTLEAWVRPEKLGGSGARIIDRITPGGADGFLFDTHPGNSLRLIVGEVQLKVADVLPAGQWSHVAAVVDPKGGRVAMYLNGKRIAEESSEAIDEASVVSRGYALQRYINACNGRGAFPIKFNGSIFTVESPGGPGGPDYRRWGPGYWWQNTRLPYIGMCASGDFDLMRPLFRMYVDQLLPLSIERTRRYFKHGGAYYPECIYFWGAVFSESYGWTPVEERTDPLQESGWHKWEWVGGLEIAWMALDYYDHAQDEAFLKERAIPFANEVMSFFEQHYQAGPDGKLVMHPSQALETWWECTNPMPELAGLHALCQRLLALPPGLATDAQRQAWIRLRDKLPPIPTHTAGGKRMLAPAEKFDRKSNIENPELYAVFPFRLYAIGKPDIELAIAALDHRWDRGHSGWRQDDVFMAYLGLAEQARKNLVARARSKDALSRFPAFWGPNYDWVPDQDHGGILVKALQSMAMQADGKAIYLLPAWPKDWNVRFKLHAPLRTTVECEYRDGKVTKLVVTPPSRSADVVLPEKRL